MPLPGLIAVLILLFACVPTHSQTGPIDDESGKTIVDAPLLIDVLIEPPASSSQSEALTRVGLDAHATQAIYTSLDKDSLATLYLAGLTIEPVDTEPIFTLGEPDYASPRDLSCSPPPSCPDYRYGCSACGLSDICIPDGGGNALIWVDISGAPSNAIVTSVGWNISIDGDLIAGCSDVWCSDYRIYLYNAGNTARQFTLWNRQGGQTDQGQDSDSEDDRDIELCQYDSSFFDGDVVNQRWYLNVSDVVTQDAGEIEYFELWVCYCTPLSSTE